MADSQPLECTVIRVTRPNTLLIRMPAPITQSHVSQYMVLHGITVTKKSAETEIIDWVELHSDFGRLSVIIIDWIRDSYGRLLGDLADRRTGERLTTYLLSRKVATDRPDHWLSVIQGMIDSPEPE